MKAWISIILFLTGIYISVSLVSYHSYDPTFSKAFYPYVAAEIQNKGGLIGANLADLLIQFLGVSSWLLPFFIGLVLYRLLARAPVEQSGQRPKRKIGRKILAVPLLFVSQGAFIGSIFVIDPMYPAETPAGGMLAEVSAYYSHLYLGQAGTVILHAFLFVASFSVLADISISRTASALKSVLRHLNTGFYRLVRERGIRGKHEGEQARIRQQSMEELALSIGRQREINSLACGEEGATLSQPAQKENP
ncbi:DNA translocase FtsK 4TM domain-containing protein [Desulfurispirillum indicum]|uniref:DNA translocase FtsK 4TM domain-containing protein n=1 Tax=Desulfurispirillum indicum TaxID=936456 RepID=UPI001CF9874A|nr:DNA translocase FtsK 4TM domain-containing protein [Desulfurispirillum indicum]UCZ57458.1 DNA translocase FtsK 4TM domain-containing protein [Desulfurispirillum indicum]